MTEVSRVAENKIGTQSPMHAALQSFSQFNTLATSIQINKPLAASALARATLSQDIHLRVTTYLDQGGSPSWSWPITLNSALNSGLNTNLASRLDAAYAAIGAPAQQWWAFGQATTQSFNFDYWLDEIEALRL
jgi:hypothetical protein